MVLLMDAHGIISNCLEYDIHSTLGSSEEAKSIVASEGGKKIAAALLRDFASGAMPTGREDNFVSDSLWKVYVKGLEKEAGIKGKHLYHPLRVFMTGRMQGPEITDQLRLLHLSGLSAKCTGEDSTGEEWAFVNPEYYKARVQPLAARMDTLKTLMQ
jgi:hypothetical protein